MTTKILALTDALGNLVRFVLLPGQRFDTVGVAPLIDGLSFGALLGDKAFDSNVIIADLNERGAKVVISQHPRRTFPLPIDRRDVQMASSDRKLLLQTQRVQTHRHARRQISTDPSLAPRGGPLPQIPKAQQHDQHPFELAVEMDLIAAEPLQLVRIERLAECLLADQRAVGQFLLASLEPRQHLTLKEAAQALDVGGGGLLILA